MKTKGARGAEAVIDRQVAARLRAQRLASGLTQSELGRRLGVTFQQVQKYENGSNRLTAGKLVMLSEMLNVPVDHFLRITPAGDTPSESHFRTLTADTVGASRAMHREVLELARWFARIEDSPTRRHILTLIKHLGALSEEEDDSQTAKAS